ncbi:MAG: A/G-specific adenine glycosylase [Verrucomicrobiales bacterium]|nr:A/G-specific adenine glycosylase [Verrucomicrobiales bacterium]
MLQQTQVKTVIPFWERWMRELPNIESLANASEDRVLKLWEGLGYYRRVRNLQKAARQIKALHNGEFPKDYDSILGLPGIGRYTAGAIGSIAFGQPLPILDGNVVRVLTRVYGVQSNPKEPKTLKRLWGLATKWVEEANQLGNFSCSALNQGMMELGATICLPNSPRCESCPIQFGCVASKKQWIDRIPAIPQRAQATREFRFAFVVSDTSNHVLIRQRPEPLVNAGLWEFPNELSSRIIPAAEAFANWSGVRTKRLKLLLSVAHSITRYRITMNVYGVQIANLDKLRSLQPGFVRFPVSRLHELAFPSAHGRVVQHLQRLSAESGDAILSKK